MLTKKYVSVFSLNFFDHNIKTVVYKVIGYVIYSFIDNFIYLDYMCILQHKLYAYENNVEKRSSMYFLGWVFLNF